MNVNKKVSRSLFPAVCLLSALACCSSAIAQQTVERMPAPQRDIVPDTNPIPAHVKQKILDHMAQTNLERLRGWPGIIFYCPVDEALNTTVKNLCTALNTQVGSLFAASNIKFQIAKNAFDVHFLPHMTGRLLLVVEIEATSQEAQPSAIFAKVKALAHYAHAVNWSSELTPGQEAVSGKGPLDVPQHVDAMLWESNMIVASGSSQEALGEPVRKGVEQRVQAFIAEFTRMNK